MTPERYQLFLDAFLTLGPRTGAVAKRLNCSPVTAHKAWHDGWPDKPWGAPISRVYADALKRLNEREFTARRDDSQVSQITEQRPKSDASWEQGASGTPGQNAGQALSGIAPRTAVEILQQSHIDAVQSEADLLQCFRGNMIGAVTLSARLLKALDLMGNTVMENVAQQAQNVPAMTPERILKPLEKLARIMGVLTQSTKAVVEMQRLLVGAPQQITESRGGEQGDPGERLERMRSLLAKLQGTGVLSPAGAAAVESEASHYAGEESGTASEPTAPDPAAQGAS